jgi:hypothetical protein
MSVRPLFVLLLLLGLLLAGCDSTTPAGDPPPDPPSPTPDDPPVTEPDPQTLFTRSAQLIGLYDGSMAVSDLNEDGALDIVISGYRTSQGNRATTYFYAGNGDGTFTYVDAGLVGVAEGSTSIADVNGDGHLDLFLTGYGYEAYYETALYLGNGDGSFSGGGDFLPIDTKWRAVPGDLNGDGHVDLFVAGDAFGHHPNVYLGDGQGQFTGNESDVVPINWGIPSLGDVTGDGHLDVLVSGVTVGTVMVTRLYAGDGTGRFTDTESNFQTVGGDNVSPSRSVLGDVNGDGLLDAVVIGGTRENRVSTELYLNDGQGVLVAFDTDLPGVFRTDLTITDVDLDGHADVLLGDVRVDDTPAAGLFLGDGTGAFVQADEVGLTGLNVTSMVTGDFDGDGDPDVAIVGYEVAGSPGRLQVFLNGTQ